MSGFDATQELLLKKLLADKAAAEAKKKDPAVAAVAAAAEKLKKFEAEVEKARVALHFHEIGATGDIGDATNKENTRMLLKDLHNMESLLAGQNTAIQGSWFKDKKNTEFIKQAEECFCALSGSIIKLLHPLNLGNYNQEAADDVENIQEASRKRQRAVVEEKDFPTTRAPRIGCTCAKDQFGNTKCGVRCPCRKENKPCSDNCRCTAENCQNPAGLPPPRPERRGRPPKEVQVPQVREFEVSATQRFPSNRQTSTSEHSYNDFYESDDGSPRRR